MWHMWTFLSHCHEIIGRDFIGLRPLVQLAAACVNAVLMSQAATATLALSSLKKQRVGLLARNQRGMVS